MLRKPSYFSQLFLILFFGFNSGYCFECRIKEQKHQDCSNPSLPALLKFPPQCSKPNCIDIPSRIGQNYWKFGIFLLQDSTGDIIGAIENECHKNAEMINLKILQKWVSGAGLPVAWDTLVQVLYDTGLNALANEIKYHYNMPNVCMYDA